jgi:membrane-bound metal-dependent hydrolase YbcI (DUF457 family)
MSSFLGHSLAAYSLASAMRQNPASPLGRLCWAGWLIALASAHDLDYLIPALSSPAHHGIRITHSIAFSLILPLCTGVALCLASNPERQRRSLSICAALAGLSHLVLDFLVGVTPLPLLWPLSAAAFISPIGVLPSAGRMQIWYSVTISLGAGSQEDDFALELELVPQRSRPRFNAKALFDGFDGLR